MGRVCPPLYGNEGALNIIKDIAKIDIKINELMVQREARVKDLEEQIQKENNSKE